MMKKRVKITNRWKLYTFVLLALIALSFVGVLLRNQLHADFEITTELGGNIFPSVILSTAATGSTIIEPEQEYLGRPFSCIAIRIQSTHAKSHVLINVEESPFFKESVSDFVLEKANTEYLVYPEIVWNYDVLKNNVQAQPVSVSVKVTLNDKELSPQVKTFSMRSVNECPTGYRDAQMRYHGTSVFFGAYVNEDHPMIDQLLKEALSAKLVRRFVGYQRTEKQVNDQVYALWYVLQKRNFRYSSITNTSLSSNMVYAQRVRTIDDALKASQINCVDGSVLFASMLKAINLVPVLVRVPGHMFVGYYLDKGRKKVDFLETTMIGDVDLDDFFPEEKLDSTIVGKTQKEVSLLTFDKSREYARRNYAKYATELSKRQNSDAGYMMLVIDNSLRRKIQPIGK